MTNNELIIIEESKEALKSLDKAPREIVFAYEVWARLVEEHGIHKLRKFKGYHDEKLINKWEGYRSSRLNRKWRVIYKVNHSQELTIIRVERVTLHDYRRR
jgi:addiction module RelE/StbE family toxin